MNNQGMRCQDTVRKKTPGIQEKAKKKKKKKKFFFLGEF